MFGRAHGAPLRPIARPVLRVGGPDMWRDLLVGDGTGNTTSATTASLRTTRAARVRGRALQRGRRTRAATRTTWVAKEAMAGTSGAGDGRDGRRRGMLDRSLRETRSESRGVKTTGGARARRGVLVLAGGYARTPTWCESVARGCHWCSRGSEKRPERRDDRWVLGSHRSMPGRHAVRWSTGWCCAAQRGRQ